MCGRFTLHRPQAEIIRELQPELWEDGDRYQPNYNVAPTTDCVVLTAMDGRRRLSLMRWGLIPHWAENPAIGSRLINARQETLTQKPSFRHLVGRRHCAVVMDGYYEWQRLAAARRPYLIRHPDHGLLLAAGLWDTWTTPEGLALRTFTVITAAAAPELRRIHDRMPAFVPAAQVDHWLQPGEIATGLLGACAGDLEALRVSEAVNRIQHNGPELLLPPPEQLDFGF